MDQYLLKLLRALVGLQPLLEHEPDSLLVQFRPKVEALVAKIKSVLPARPGGGAWTDEEIAEAAVRAEIPWADTLAAMRATRTDVDPPETPTGAPVLAEGVLETGHASGEEGGSAGVPNTTTGGDDTPGPQAPVAGAPIGEHLDD